MQRARKREIDQRARKPGREGKVQESSGSCQGNRSLGRRKEGKKLKFKLFLMLLFCSSASLHPSPAALGPWKLGRLEKQAEKRKRHDPTCLKEGKTL